MNPGAESSASRTPRTSLAAAWIMSRSGSASWARTLRTHASRDVLSRHRVAWRTHPRMTSMERRNVEPDIVRTAADAEGVAKPPLLILDRVRAFLDEHGLGSGSIRASRIGEGGGSNFTFLLERDDGRFVLRRPPRPPLPPSAHDMVREARLQLALAPHGVRLPTIRAVCEDESVLGVPFYVMDYLDGHVITSELPPGLESAGARRRLAFDLVDALVEIHAVDVNAPGVADFIRPGSYLERQ